MEFGTTPLNPRLGIRRTILNALPARRHAFKADSRETAEAWKPRARGALLKALGDTIKKADPNPQVLEDAQLDGYRRITMTFTTTPGIDAIGWLCIPDGVNANNPAPAMIATPGHGMGAKDLLAMDPSGSPREEGEGHQKDYALAAVRMGYVTFTIEPMGFGERRDELDMNGEDNSRPCDRAGNLLLMLGRTLAGQRVHDLRCALDLLEQRPEVIGDRIGMMGISGGGQMTLWTTAVEPRLKVAIVSGYFNRFADSVLGIHHCSCNFLPGLARDLDMVDIAAIEAPRPLLIQSGAKDEIFPVDATRAAHAELEKIYALYGAEDRLVLDIFEGGHQWSTTHVESFLKTWL